MLLVLITVVVLVGAWCARRRARQSTLPQLLPQAETLSYDQIVHEKGKYLAGLRSERELEAFHKGRILAMTKERTWSGSADNLGESGIVMSETSGRRQREAFAMGIHFAREEAKALNKR